MNEQRLVTNDDFKTVIPIYSDAVPLQNGHDFNGALIGAVLGDGHLQRFGLVNGVDGANIKGPKWNRTFMQIYHTEPQLEYLIWKAKLFSKYVELNNNGNIIMSKHIGCGNKVAKAVWRPSNKFHYLYSDIYKGAFRCFDKRNKPVWRGGVKTVTEKILNRISPLGFSILFGDDGSVWKDKSTYRHILCTHSFSREENELICEVFNKRFGFKYYVRKQKQYTCLTTKSQHLCDVLDFVKPHLIEVKCLNYKLCVF